MIDIDFPQQFRPLFDKKRYKFVRGGRGSTKSWSFARALLIKGTQEKLRILCAREIQKSIKDSVHRLLSDRIVELGLSGFYEILRHEIRGQNGTIFLFSGLSDQTVETIKSFEGVDITWIEEAKNITQRSLDIALPTVLRKPTSELWVTFNPELDTDPIYKLAVTEFSQLPEDNAVSIEVNLDDVLPFLEEHGMAESLLELRDLHRRTKTPEEFKNIWEGKCLPAVQGAIYANEVRDIVEQSRLCNVPYDPMYKVQVVFDLGWNDAMSIAMVQRVGSELRVINYIEDSHRTLDSYSEELKKLEYNWGKVYLPHDGFAKKHQTGKADAEVLQAMGWKVVPKEQLAIMGIEQGIKSARMALPRMIFDQKAARLVECIKRYRRHIPQNTNEPGDPVHDEYSHGADCLRYIAVNAHQFSNETGNSGPLNYPNYSVA